MNKLAWAVLAAALIPAGATAQMVTVQSELGERGFPDGLVLRGQNSSNIFVPLPRGVPLTNGRLLIDAQSLSPTLLRGSFSVLVNGQPIDALELSRASGPAPVQRTIALRDDRLNGFDALNISFRSDLRTNADLCREDFDPANSVTLLPASRLLFDLDISKVRSVADAFALLPRRPLVQLPAQPEVSPEVATSALQLGVILTERGMEPRFDSARGEDLVAFRLGSTRDGADGSPSVRVERNGNMVDIVIDPGSDLVAFARMLQIAPNALVGARAALSQGPARPKSASEDFRAFAVLPAAMRIKRYGEWRLNFPLVANNGRLAEKALLKLFISPDWSGERPIMTTYLNDQIVAATRPSLDQSDVTVALPVSLLRFSNTLRVTLERAGGENICAAADEGQAAQILPGSGVQLGDRNGTGFIRIAHAFGSEGQVAFPQAAAETSAIGPYLRLASKTLASFGAHAGNLSVGFGPTEASGAGGLLRLEDVGPGGLVLSMADVAEARDLRYRVSSPLAVMSADADGRTMLVQLSDAANIPQPKSLYLGGGSTALIADEGVVWQANIPTTGPTIVQNLRTLREATFSQTGMAIGLAGLALIGLLMSSRAVIKTVFNRIRRRRAGK